MITNYLKTKNKNNSKLINQVINRLDPSKVSDSAILSFIDNSSLAPSTLRKHYKILESYEEYLMARGLVTEPKFKKYRYLLPKLKQVRPTQLIDFELIPEIIKSAPKPYDLMLDLLFHLGLRRSELINLTKQDFKDNKLTLRDTKNTKTYVIELPERLVIRLQEHIEFLLSDKLFSMSVTKFYRFFKAHLLKFKIKAAPHSARATAATFLKSKGLCDRDVALSLHQSEQTVRLYDKRSKEQISNQYLNLINYG